MVVGLAGVIGQHALQLATMERNQGQGHAPIQPLATGERIVTEMQWRLGHVKFQNVQVCFTIYPSRAVLAGRMKLNLQLNVSHS